MGEVPEEARKPLRAAANGEISAANLRFLEVAANDPEWLDPESFEPLRRKSEFTQYGIQPWPTFVDRETIDAAGEMNSRLCRLIKAIPERLFRSDPSRLAEYYRLDPRYAALITALLRRPTYPDGLVARGDWIRTAEGFRCVEMNFGGNLGGWQCSVWAADFEGLPLFHRFLRATGLTYRHRHPARAFFAHVLDMAHRSDRLDEGVLRVAFVVPEDRRSGFDVAGFAAHALSETLADIAPELEGEALVCSSSELAAGPDGLRHQGRRVHAVSQPTFEPTAGQVARSLLQGTVDVYNGPARDVLFDKRNLALLSENQESEVFDRHERGTIAAHVPWTREVRDGTTTWEGERSRLSDVLSAFQDRLVLKPATASQGRGVVVGRKVPKEAWHQAMTSALAAPEPWIAQELAESQPFLYLDADRGPCDQDVIWGLFCFGRSYGGGYLRLMPKEGSTGVVNAARGATPGVLFEVGSDEPPESVTVSPSGNT